MYQITAVVSKHGGLPVNWLHRSKTKMTKAQCLAYFQRPIGDYKLRVSVTINDFKCVKVKK